MADAVAKAHLEQPVEAGLARRIAEGVRTRDCLYEVASDYADGVWSLADRRCFGLARRCLSRWVRAELLARTETLQRIDELGIEAAGLYGNVEQMAARQPGSNIEPVGPALSLTAMPRYLNNRASSIYGGSNEVQRNVMAKLLLGL